MDLNTIHCLCLLERRRKVNKGNSIRTDTLLDRESLLILQKYSLPPTFDVLMVIFGAMVPKIKNGIALAIVPQILLIKWLAGHPQLIETYYSEGLYPWISQFFRVLYGWIPFSVGDILYFILAVLAFRYVVKHRKEIRNYPLRFGRDVLFVLSITYFSFHLLWGLNYYRLPIAEKFGLTDTYTPNELDQLVVALIKKTNEAQFGITKDTALIVQIPYSKKEIFDKTLVGYEHLKEDFPFVAYERPSIKKSLFSTPLTYMGYGGYLNPFTHEGQANGRLPNFRFPVVTGHEMGHQVGYSAENETNFIGYLATLYNPDPYFKYSAYAYALAYCLSDIRNRDEQAFEDLYAQLNPGVRKNFKEMADFWESFENPLEPVFKAIYSRFLKANNQTKGIESYNAVVSLMVAYHQKHPF